MSDLRAEREAMVRRQIADRGVRDERVLDAMCTVPREAFLPPELGEFAYQDSALPIASGQTISQPYIVALMTEALDLEPGDRVLEIGTGSGYAAAILGRIAREVHTIERHEDLAEVAARRLREQGFENVHVVQGDGTLGLPEHAPYDAIVVTAGGPKVPSALREQLAVGGRLVIPVGVEKDLQTLRRVTRTPGGSFDEEDLGGVRFVPLVGAEGWGADPARALPAVRSTPHSVSGLVREAAEPFAAIEQADLGPILERIGDARVVLLGEATHGTSEFYRLRARLTRELVRSRGFRIVAVEADWPDAMRVHRYVQGLGESGRPWQAFARFPTWMWRNREVMGFVEWLREWNAAQPPDAGRAGFFGLDLYSLYTSIRLVLEYLDRVDAPSARVARERYGCLTPWEGDPATYGRAALSGRYRTCEKEAVSILRDMVEKELEYAARDGLEFLDAAQNARLVADAERYYRVMYYGGAESWNLRDRHMFETLEALLRLHGPEESKAVLWAHNSHLGNAAATDMGLRGEWNVGELCREKFGERAFLVGFGTHEGTVAAAHEWDGPVREMRIRPSHPESYERLCHESGVAAFFLHLREPARDEVRVALEPARLERAIGVLYRPETELRSHYFHASLPNQFDEYVWTGETRAVRPLGPVDVRGLPRAHPFSLYGPP